METKRLKNAPENAMFPLAELLQHYGHTGRTGMFLVNFNDDQGYIYLVTGIIAHAETSLLSGESAVWDMLSHTPSTYEWIESETSRQMTMSAQVQDVVLRSIQMQNSGELDRIRTESKTKIRTRNIHADDITCLISLDVSSKEIAPFVYNIQSKQVRVGRHAENDLVLSDSSVSRKHAILIQNRDTLLVRDLGSLNGIRVDGQHLTQGLVHSQQILQIGEVILKVRSSQVESQIHSEALSPSI